MKNTIPGPSFRPHFHKLAAAFALAILVATAPLLKQQLRGSSPILLATTVSPRPSVHISSKPLTTTFAKAPATPAIHTAIPL